MDRTSFRGGPSLAIVIGAFVLVAAVFFIGGIGFDSPRNIEVSLDAAQAGDRVER